SPLLSTPFPYTTLFRSRRASQDAGRVHDVPILASCMAAVGLFSMAAGLPRCVQHVRTHDPQAEARHPFESQGCFSLRLPERLDRSEEHTSELQSRVDIV